MKTNRTLWLSLSAVWLVVLCIGVMRWWGPSLDWPKRNKITTTVWKTNEVYHTNIIQVTLVTNYIETAKARPFNDIFGTNLYVTNWVSFATNGVYSTHATNWIITATNNPSWLVMFTNGVIGMR